MNQVRQLLSQIAEKDELIEELQIREQEQKATINQQRQDANRLKYKEPDGESSFELAQLRSQNELYIETLQKLNLRIDKQEEELKIYRTRDITQETEIARLRKQNQESFEHVYAKEKEILYRLESD